MKTIIIDDSELLRERLRSLLDEIEGIELAGEAESLKQGQELVERVSPDVIFLDIRLRDGVSIDFIKKLKMMHSQPIVIILTDYPYPQYRIRCLESGADYFLEKQGEFEKIPELVGRLIKTSPHEDVR